MVIRIQEGPQDGVSILQQRLPALYRTRQHRRAEGGASPNEMILSRPHQVFTIDASDLTTDDPISHAYAIAWRYLVLDGENAVAAAEVNEDIGGSQFAGYFTGQHANATMRALDAVSEKLDDNTQWELRLLRIPEIYVAVLWLHADASDDFVPMEDVGDDLRRLMILNRERMNHALQRLGESRGFESAADDPRLEEGMDQDEEQFEGVE